MANIVDKFEHAHEYQNDVWVADYTEQTRFEPESAKKGVCVSESEFDDIKSFHLQNPKHVVIYGVNFEEHPHFFPKKRRIANAFSNREMLSMVDFYFFVN